MRASFQLGQESVANKTPWLRFCHFPTCFPFRVHWKFSVAWWHIFFIRAGVSCAEGLNKYGTFLQTLRFMVAKLFPFLRSSNEVRCFRVHYDGAWVCKSKYYASCHCQFCMYVCKRCLYSFDQQHTKSWRTILHGSSALMLWKDFMLQTREREKKNQLCDDCGFFTNITIFGLHRFIHRWSINIICIFLGWFSKVVLCTSYESLMHMIGLPNSFHKIRLNSPHFFSAY